MPCLIAAAATTLALLTGTSRSAPSTAAAPGHVREIADLTLPDVAMAVYHPVSSIIFYNPRRMEAFSPGLQTFFMAHERAHIELKHRRASALRAEGETRNRLLQRAELEADCLAVVRLGESGRQEALEAMRYFAREKSAHLDDEHPAGTERARNILECMAE